MFFLSFLLFSVIYVDGEDYIKIYRSSSEMNLFFVEKGFYNPAAGYGIVGADLNPATLGRSGDVEFFTAFSLPGVSGNAVNDISIDTEERGVIDIVNRGELYAQYRALGGINFLGFSKKFGRFGVGMTYGAGYKLGFEASLSGRVYGDFQSDEPFEFTHEDFSEIDSGEVVSVNPYFSGAIAFENPVPLKVEYSDIPISLGTGINFGPLGVGAGLKFQSCRILGEGGFSTHIDSLVMKVRDTVVIDDDGDDWIIEDCSASLDFDEDLVNGAISSTGLSNTHTIFNIGALLDAGSMKLSFGFDLGANYELAGGYAWDFSWISDLPDSFVSVDSSRMTIITDSLIRGRAVVVIDSMIRDGESDSDDNVSFMFSGSSVNLGFLLEPLNFGITARLPFPSADYALGKVGIFTYGGIPAPVIDINWGLAMDFLLLDGWKFNSIKFGNDAQWDEWHVIPSAIVGLTFSYERDNLRYYLPIKYDLSHIASAIIGNVLGDEDSDRDFVVDLNSNTNVFNNLSFGFGFRVKM
jgi:hypothetical protein